MPDLQHLAGWFSDGGHHALAASIGARAFRDIASHLLLAAEPSKPILLYKAWKQLLGSYPGYPAQQIGDCTSFGTGHCNDLLQAVEICLGEQSVYQETDTEFLYGEGRKVSGGLGWFDGSYGAAMVKAALTVGLLSRQMLGTDGVYSGQRAKAWGRTGPPANYEQMAAPYKLGAVALIKDKQSAISALWNGHPFTICSNQGFTMQRDQDGYCAASGHWAHCMFVSGYDPAKNRFCIVQSWGANTPSGPTYLDQPDFSFWADADVVERNILSQGDSWALFKAPDFAKRAMPGELMVA